MNNSNERLESNRRIIASISEYVESHPEMRFMQALYAMKVCDPGSDYFYKESVETEADMSVQRNYDHKKPKSHNGNRKILEIKLFECNVFRIAFIFLLILKMTGLVDTLWILVFIPVFSELFVHLCSFTMRIAAFGKKPYIFKKG